MHQGVLYVLLGYPSLAGPGCTLVPSQWCSLLELLVKSQFRGPKWARKPDFESSRLADSGSGLRSPALFSKCQSPAPRGGYITEPGFGICAPRALEIRSRFSI